MKQLIAVVLIFATFAMCTIVVVSCKTSDTQTITVFEDSTYVPISSATVTTTELSQTAPETTMIEYSETETAIIEETTVEDVKYTTEENETAVVEVTPYYSITAEERDMIATLVFLESSVCSTECKRAIVSTIFNRLDSGKWQKDMNKDGTITLYDVVYYPNAFSPSNLIDSYRNETTKECYEAVDYVVMNGPTIPAEVRYFRTKHDFGWKNYANYCVMDNVYFGYFTNWNQGAW